jgi:MSHA biogenesis protein MshE
VFSTLHTMNAVATVNRLLDMGAAGFMIAAAVHGIVAQRLVRQVCSDCSQPHEPDAHELAWLRAQVGAERAAAIKFHIGAGCTYCNLSGYRGRVAIYELLEIDRTQADAIRRNDLIAFAAAARSRPGYVSLTHSALELASRGVTTLAEVIGVTSGLDEAPEHAADGVQVTGAHSKGTQRVSAAANIAGTDGDDVSDALLSGRAS